jgi:hypothetical protein
MIVVLGLLIVLCERREHPLSWDLQMGAYNTQLGCQVYFCGNMVAFVKLL